MTAFSPILPMLYQYYRLADWPEAAAQYIAAHDIDLEEVAAHAGIFTALDLAFHFNGTFDFYGKTRAIVIEVYAEDDETAIDLCAWPIGKPEAFATGIGAASILGSAQVTNPASWAFGDLLKVHRTPLEWLKAGCQGTCILDYRYASHELGQALGPILAQDEHHAGELKRLLCKSPVDPKNILYPRNNFPKAA